MKEDKNNLATRTQRRYGEEARAEMTAPACEVDGGTGTCDGCGADARERRGDEVQRRRVKGGMRGSRK